MKHFKKTKQLVEGKSFDRQERDKINDITGDLRDQKREKEEEDRLKPSGEIGDQQLRAPVNPDGSPISLDDIKNRQPEKGLPGGGAPPSGVGIGTHGNQKRGGIFNRMYRGANTLDSMWQVAKKGMPMRPVKDDVYEDEEGNLRRFGKVTTGRAGGNPYYFEFDHYDKASDQNLVLYGIAPGGNMPGAELRPIQLKVKAIVPRDKMDVRPMTAPTDDNVQSNFVSEAKKFSKDGAENATYAQNGHIHSASGEVRNAKTGRFGKGNQSGVQFAPGGNVDSNELAVVAGGVKQAIGKAVPSLRDIMRGGSSYSYSGSSGTSDNNDGPNGGTSGTGGGYTTIRRQYRPDYKKQDSDQINIPKNLWYHPTIQRMIKRFIAMDKGVKRVKIGSYYGMLVRRDPADKDSDYKLVRKIPRSHIPKVFLDDDFIAELLEVVPIPPDLGGSGAAAAAVPALGMVVQQKTGLPLNASAGAAMTAIASTGAQLNIAGKPSPMELPGRASGGNEIKISPPNTAPVGLPLKENKKLITLIDGVELNEGFASWLGSMVGSGIKITRSIAGKTKRIIKSTVEDFEKSSGIKLNKVDYSNLLSMIANEIKHPWGGDHTQQPAWSNDIKGGPEDVDLDPDNNVDFVGDTRPDPTGQSPEPTPEPATEPTPEPTAEPTKEPTKKHKWEWVSPYRDITRINPHSDEQKQIDSRLMEIDKEVIEFHNNMTLDYAVKNMIAGYKKYKHPKPSPQHMLGLADEPAEQPDSDTYFGRDWNQTALNQLLINKSQWPDLTTHDLLAMDELPITQYHTTKPPDMDWEHWFELLTQNVKGKATRQWLADELNIPMFVDWASETLNFSGGGTRTKNKLDNTQSALQYLGRMAWERDKINIFSPDYEFNPNHFKAQPGTDMYDYSDIDSSGKKVPEVKVRNRRNRRRGERKSFEESFVKMRKLVTGN